MSTVKPISVKILAVAVAGLALLFVIAWAVTSRNGSGPSRSDDPLGDADMTPGPESQVQAAPRSIPRSLQMLTVAEPHLGPPAYDRSLWQHWVDEDRDCQDTRQEVLIVEARGAVTFASGAMCRVIAGVWFDEYTGATLTNPGDLDVDHLVPLKNAHISGGWSWSAEQRRAYANDLAHADQLIGVSASANRAKGDQGPTTWKPPRTEYWCEYAVSWIAVKNHWTLTITVAEQEALLSMLAACPPGRSEGGEAGR